MSLTADKPRTCWLVPHMWWACSGSSLGATTATSLFGPLSSSIYTKGVVTRPFVVGHFQMHAQYTRW